MTDQIKEIFTLPLGLKPVVKFNNDELYGSKSLNKKFIKALSKVPRTKGISKQIGVLVNNKSIIPCFFQKGFKDFLAWRIFKSKPITMQFIDYEIDENGDPIEGTGKTSTVIIDERKAAHSIMGFYTPEHEKIILIMSNSLNIFAYAPNDFLSELTLHELMHMVALQKQSKFLSIFKQDLISFYSSLWSQIFYLQKNKIKENDIKNILSFVLKLERQKSKISNGDLIKYYKLMENLKEYSNLSDEKFTKQLIDYIVIIKIYLKNISLFFSKIKKYQHIIVPIYKTYEEVFGLKNLTSVCIQELIYPSEVIAIYSETGTSPKFKAAVNSLT